MREKSKLLKGMHYLDKRMNLQAADKRYLLNLEKGYQGERLFDELAEKYINGEIIILNDLLLENSGTSFQVDSLFITTDTVYVYEIKNYRGDYILNSGELMTVSGMSIGNPLIQLKRIHSFISLLLKEWGYTFKIESKVVYVNKSFTLYQARVDDPIILPTQLKEHLTTINRKSRSLSKQSQYLANKLIQLHKFDLPYQKQLPYYNYNTLKKGVSCCECGSFNMLITQRSSYCKACFAKNTVAETVLENIREYQFLFPDKTLTTTVINEWCGNAIYKNKIRQILKDNYDVSGKTNGAYYM